MMNSAGVGVLDLWETRLESTANEPHADGSLDTWMNMRIPCVTPWGDELDIVHIWPSSDIACHSLDLWQDDQNRTRSMCTCDAFVDLNRPTITVIHELHRLTVAEVIPMRRS